VAAVSTETRTLDPSALRRLLDGRYREVRAEWARSLTVEGLVDACGIPDELLGAPIGLADPGPEPD
jgi:hypothetical protein